jgi:hypothetical protein
MGNGTRIEAGEPQRMSAGTGVTHSEFNASSTAPLHFLQIWIEPSEEGLEPSYEQRRVRTDDWLNRGVVYPVESFDPPTGEWCSPQNGPWRRGRLPTRGEYLIRTGGVEKMRRCRAVLILRDPYLAVVSAEEM